MKAGELYRYAPDAGKWCRHGLRLLIQEDGGLYARDTYWGHGEYSDPRPAEEIADQLEFVLDLSAARKTIRDEWERYADKDRAYIPIGGGSEQYWVSKDAKKDPQRERERLECNLARAESDLRTAQHSVEWERRKLAEFLEAQGGAV